MALKFIEIETTDRITVATLNRPPVNALSEELYRDLITLSDQISSDTVTRCLVVTSAPECRAWIGGAELKEFLVLRS